MIKFLYVTRVQSVAFSPLTPAHPVLVPQTAWQSSYSGAVITWHDRSELDRYIAEKVRGGAILIH